MVKALGLVHLYTYRYVHTRANPTLIWDKKVSWLSNNYPLGQIGHFLFQNVRNFDCSEENVSFHVFRTGSERMRMGKKFNLYFYLKPFEISGYKGKFHSSQATHPYPTKVGCLRWSKPAALSHSDSKYYWTRQERGTSLIIPLFCFLQDWKAQTESPGTIIYFL